MLSQGGVARPTSWTERWTRYWPTLVVLGVGCFMFAGAGRYTVFDDEAFSCQRYAMPFVEMVSALRQGAEPDPPLYYVLMNGWTRVFGVGPLGLRSLSIILFLVSLVFIRRAGEAWFDRRVGRAAMLLCALHPAHLFFGFAARWYSLMFLMVAVLLWLTARMAGRGACDGADAGFAVKEEGSGELEQRRIGLGLIVAWSFVAAATCYTNYFGPVVVALLWGVGQICSRRCPGGVVRWCGAGVLAVVLCVPWISPFVSQLCSGYPAAEASCRAVLATAVRTTLALLAGNLASIEAWWVLGPIAFFAIGMVVLLFIHWRAVWPIAVISLGCFVAGVASRTMIDKYVMTFSGPMCLLAAALLVRVGGGRGCLGSIAIDDGCPSGQSLGRKPSDGASSGGASEKDVSSPCLSFVRRATLACLILGWLGCGVNLATQRYWSSLRWLDPFPQITSELWETEEIVYQDNRVVSRIVTSHPSARYYLAVLRAERNPQPFRKENSLLDMLFTDRVAWRTAMAEQESVRPRWDYRVATPEACSASPEWLVRLAINTLQTAGFSNMPDWDQFQILLEGSHVLLEERSYFEDPDAAMKDRLDPNVKHPRWRIVVRKWEKKP